VIRNLSYIGFITPASEEWRTFGPEILGAQLTADGPDGAVRLRVDRAPWRIALHPGERDELAYLGWDIGTDLEDATDRIAGAGIAVHRNVHTRERPAEEVATFWDPFGFRHELATSLGHGEPFEPGREMSGFVTGDQGLGHVVLIVPDLDYAVAFYTTVLGFELSDSIETFLSLRFLHCPGHASRHHTLALACVPGMTGLHHLMLEVADMDDVGRAYDVVRQRDLRLAMDLGRHTNDLMTSFYVRSPSGFEIEYGTGGVLVDDRTWEVATYDSGSIWGHHPPPSGALLPGILRPIETEGASA
jgi:3,4-dihydroxy-9,10-secoandrosta-1,3,5(10)-triene-9,17-dione 4,5-dioxygenase